MATTYTIVQTVESLNFASNAVGGIMHAPEVLQQYMEVYLAGGTTPDNQQFAGYFNLMNPFLDGGDWATAWGPSVYCEGSGPLARATNTMFVAHSKSQAMYVVAIAGTNFDSIDDWMQEDANVQPAHMASFPIAIPYEDPNNSLPLNQSIAYVSGATADGVTALLTKLSDPKSGQGLQDFLNSVVNAGDTLVFTGHSLAGALSPTLAMQLYPTPATSGWKTVLVQPSAGASPGNATFAAAYATAYPATPTGLAAPFDNWNVNYASERDVVPHAWNRLDQVFIPAGLPDVTKVLGTFQTFYGWIKNVAPDMAETKLDTLLISATGRAAGGGYANLPLNQFTPDWGTYDKDGNWVALPVYSQDSPITKWADLDPLILAAHTTQYARFFGVKTPKLPTKNS